MELELEVENFAGSGAFKGLNSPEATLSLSSVIEMGGKRKARMSLVDARIHQAEWEQQASTLDVLGELTASYIESLATQASIQLAEESLALSQSLLKTVKRRSNKGATPEAEVMRAQAAVTRPVVNDDLCISQICHLPYHGIVHIGPNVVGIDPPETRRMQINQIFKLRKRKRFNILKKLLQS